MPHIALHLPVKPKQPYYILGNNSELFLALDLCVFKIPSCKARHSAFVQPSLSIAAHTHTHRTISCPVPEGP